MKTARKNIKEAKTHLKKARDLMARSYSKFKGMSGEEVIAELRKTREKLWEEKLAHSP